MTPWFDNFEVIPPADLVVHVGEAGHTFTVVKVLDGFRPISDDGWFEDVTAYASRDEAAEAAREAIAEAVDVARVARVARHEAIHGPADAPIDYWPTTPAERAAAARLARAESRDVGVG